MSLRPGTVSEDRSQFWDGDAWGWQPLWLTVDQVEQAVTELYRMPTAEPQYLASGMLNQSWRVGAVVLRVSRPARTAPQLRYEHRMLAELGATLPEIVAPIPARNGPTLQSVHGRQLSLFPFVAGTLGSELSAESRRRPTATMMARAHRVSLERLDFDQRPGFHAVDDRSRWLWPRLSPMLRREVADVDEQFALFDDEVGILNAWLGELERSGRNLPRAVVQGDTNPRNLIFNGSDLVAVIDWDECQVDLLHAAIAREAYASADPESFWHSYLQAGGPLDPDSFDVLAGFARLSAFIELMWTDHDGHANPHSPGLIRGVAEDIERMRQRAPL